MSRIIKSQSVSVGNSKSIISFETTGGGNWKIWDRYICIKGNKAYHIGNICGTCAFFFERMDGANQTISPHELSHILKAGLTDLNQDFLDNVKLILPNGKYIAALMEIEPKLIEIGSKEDYFCKEQVDSWGIDRFWGLPHYPKVKYYRGTDQNLGEAGLLFEFIVPMTPQNWLKKETICEYQNSISSGEKPTAIAITILDIKAHYDKGISHWCLSHYLLDGHHKVFASAIEEKPITLLSFLALGEGISTDEKIKKLFWQL